ncbi:MAG: VC_2705 family sodium/solute symporter [Burkholderiaceae bacterium]|nr:VC_2705 family sodium/solute symporter [Burkholderiaceae bacterium]
MPRRWGLVLVGLMSVVGLSLSLWMADLMGVSKAYINAFFLLLSIVGYAVIGMFCRTTQPEEYFVAGRRITAPFNGMATAADWMSAASFIGLTGLLLNEGYIGDGFHAGGLAYVLGWTGGFCLLCFLFARKLQESQAVTIPDMLGNLFGSTAVRWFSAWGAILCSSIYLVAQIYGIGLVTSMLSGLTFELGMFLALGGILLCSFLGGMRAITWTQVVQCVVIVASMVALAVAVSWREQGHPVVPAAAWQDMLRVNERAQEIALDPQEHATTLAMEQRLRHLDEKMADPIGAREVERQILARQLARLKEENASLAEIQRLESNPAWRDISEERMVEAWRQERDRIQQGLNRPVGFKGLQTPGADRGLFNTLALVFCLMLGSAALPHILVRSFSAASPRHAELSLVWALLFIAAVYLCASSLAVMLKHSVLTELVGARLDQLPDWAEQLKLRRLPLLYLNDWNRDGIVQFGDIRIANDYLMLAVPDIMRISPVFTGLIAAGALAAALSTADGLLLTIANALSHDLYFQTMKPKASAVRQVMLSKVLLMLVALTATWLATNQPVDILFWVACAFSLAASTFFPVLLLGLHWPGMSRAGALAAMVAGMGVSLYYIVVNYHGVQKYFGLAPEQTLWLGLEPFSAGVFGVPAGLLCGVLFSWLRPGRG